MKCDSCSSNRMQRSRIRVRIVDILRLFLLQLPVRCHSCYERAYASVYAVLRLSLGRRKMRRSERLAGKVDGNSAAA